MDLDLVAEEIRTALGGIAGLRRPAWGVEKVTPPAVLVALPERIDYDATYARGKDVYEDLPLIVLVGNPTERTAFKRAAVYADGSGPTSVKTVLEAYTWTTCGRVDVPWCEFDVPTYAGVRYLGVIFHLKIIGKGA